jgi:hypothetical protein
MYFLPCLIASDQQSDRIIDNDSVNNRLTSHHSIAQHSTAQHITSAGACLFRYAVRVFTVVYTLRLLNTVACTSDQLYARSFALAHTARLPAQRWPGAWKRWVSDTSALGQWKVELRRAFQRERGIHGSTGVMKVQSQVPASRKPVTHVVRCDVKR